MKLAIFTIFSMVAILLILTQGCGGISNADQIFFPDTGVSYSQQVEPFFTLACNTAGCHNAADAAGDVDLSTYTSILNSLNGGLVLVDKSNPGYDTSCILDRTLFGEEPHAAPLNVNQNQRDGIRQWIYEGALLN
jgi:hypothetical protein